MGSQADPRLIKALSHPLRVQILGVLESWPRASPVELATELDVSLGVASYHVRRLHQLGFLELVQQRPVRGAVQHFYRAKSDRPKLSSEQWSGMPPIMKRAIVRSQLGELAALITDAGEAGGFEWPHAHASRVVLRVDEEAWSEVSNLIGEAQDRLDAITAASAARQRTLGGEGAVGVLVIAVFDATGVRSGGSGSLLAGPVTPTDV
jgi:DNA-binding transcriptional ArsR family regulator